MHAVTRRAPAARVADTLVRERIEMTKSFRWLVAALAWIGGAAPLAAQVPADTVTPRIEVRALPRTGDVVLRLIPSTSISWFNGLLGGYRVERAEVAPGAQPAAAAFQEIGTVGVWGEAEWVAFMDTTNQNLMSAAEVLFADPAPLPEGRLEPTPEEQRAEVDRRFFFALIVADADSLAASALGIRFVDRTANPGSEYVYRVSVRTLPEDYRSLAITVAAGTARVNFTGAPQLPEPPGLAVEVGDGRLTLVWDPDPAGLYVAYDVERSEQGGAPVPLNEQPLVFSPDSLDQAVIRVLLDTAVVNYRTYRYQVYGRTLFGERGPPAVGVGTPRDLTPPSAPVITEGAPLADSLVRLTWELGDSLAAPDLRGFLVGHGTSDEGPFAFDTTTVLPPATRSVSVAEVTSGALNYYVVAAADTAGNYAYSLPRYVHFIDTVPPAPPTAVVAVADTLGVVTLSWPRGSEPDLFGYRVFKANQEDHEFTLVTGEPVTDTLFADTVAMGTLTRAVYYEVTALDLSQNPSDPTRTRVVLPDRVPPEAPAILTVTPSDSAVALGWAPSASADLRAHIVLRMTDDDERWSEIAQLPADAEAFVDRDVQRRRVYYYIVQAEDSTGLRSSSDAVQARPYDTGARPPVEGITASADEEAGVVRLLWSYPAPAPGTYWFVVYRGVGDGELQAYRTAGTSTSFEDRSVAGRSETRYRYSVQVLYADGGAAPLPPPVAVSYRR